MTHWFEKNRFLTSHFSKSSILVKKPQIKAIQITPDWTKEAI